MAVPPVPPPLEQLGQRPFSFYPPISNILHNEWFYRKATWSEVLVQNTKTNEEIWVARRFIGPVSRVDEPVMIVGLIKELEFKAGTLWPVERRIIEIPLAVNDSPRPRPPDPLPQPAPVIGIRLESSSESRIGRLILGGIALGIVGCVLVVTLYRGGVLGNKIMYAPIMQSDLGLSAYDDYHAVVRLLGPPAEDHWRSDKGEMQYRVLSYPQHGYYILLMGRDRGDTHYIGAMDKNWTPVHSVQLPGKINSYSLLRTITKF